MSHLDEIHREHATRRLGSLLKFKQGNVTSFKQRSVELRIFSEDLSDSSYERFIEIEPTQHHEIHPNILKMR